MRAEGRSNAPRGNASWAALHECLQKRPIVGIELRLPALWSARVTLWCRYNKCFAAVFFNQLIKLFPRANRNLDSSNQNELRPFHASPPGVESCPEWSLNA